MLGTLIVKELKAIIVSPKFVATFLICAVLMLLSVFIGIQEYRNAVRQYETATQLVEEGAREATGWHNIPYRAYRQPDPMQIFVSGLGYDVGRFSSINTREIVKLRSSAYSDDPIFAVFRFIDFAFIVQVVLSLLAILFTYDAINGEREEGTLKLVFANPVPRARYLLAKCIGGWLGLVVPIMIPLLLCLLLVIAFNVPLTTEHWFKLLMLMAVSVLYFTFFVAFGVLISALTRRPSVSFLLALVGWIVFILIIPRAGVIISGQLLSVPSVAEIEGQSEGFAKDRWQAFYEEQEKRWQERNAHRANSDGNSQAVSDEQLWKYMEEDDAARKAVQQEIESYQTKLNIDLQNRHTTQERLAFTLSRFSPASAYLLAAMNLAGTGVELKSRYEESLRNFRDQFVEFIEAKQAEGGPSGAFTISIDTQSGLKIGTPRDQGALDVSQLPRFTPPQYPLMGAAAATVVDFGLLALYSILAFGAAFVAFSRYDVR